MHLKTYNGIGGKEKILEEIRNMPLGKVNIMEVCGTHTMSIAKSGIKYMLPENVRLLSGPGCPVCVTPEEIIDGIMALSERKDIIITTYGDMIRVPGSTPGDNLQLRRAKGARVEVVYSPLDGIEIAQNNPDKQVVFLGVGFETTAPGTAAAIQVAREGKVKNFTVLSMMKTVEPALRALISDPDFNVQGFLCPGHVATIIGEKGFEFLINEFKIPAVIAGFEPEDILTAVYKLLLQMEKGEPKLENEYRRAVMPEGNPLAVEMVNKYFEPVDDLWRGLGMIPKSGLGIRSEFEEFDAVKRFDMRFPENGKKTACSCGEIIMGKAEPKTCPLFGRVCVPENPVGPCMVSSEGACAAAYKYQGV